jgi:cell division protein FtsB
MEQLNTFRRNLVSKLIIFTITFSALYFVFDTYEVSYKNYRSMQATLENRIEHSETLKKEINDYQVKIDNLNDPDKLDLILQEHGYGKDGEVLHKFDVPEAVTPLEETIGRERNKGAFELLVEFIIGTNDESQ